MRAKPARYLLLRSNRYTAFQAVDICPHADNRYSRVRVSELSGRLKLKNNLYDNFQLSVFNFRFFALRRYTRSVPSVEKGCRDRQQVGECRRARTKTYVTEAEPTRSPYMRRYMRSDFSMASKSPFKYAAPSARSKRP